MWRGKSGALRVLPLLCDGNAVVEEAERLRAQEGEEVRLDMRMGFKADGWSICEDVFCEVKLLEVLRVFEG